jgi:hypothetical protein
MGIRQNAKARKAKAKRIRFNFGSFGETNGKLSYLMEDGFFLIMQGPKRKNYLPSRDQ